MQLGLREDHPPARSPVVIIERAKVSLEACGRPRVPRSRAGEDVELTVDELGDLLRRDGGEVGVCGAVTLLGGLAHGGSLRQEGARTQEVTWLRRSLGDRQRSAVSSRSYEGALENARRIKFVDAQASILDFLSQIDVEQGARARARER